MPAPLDPLNKNRYRDGHYKYPLDVGNNSKYSHVVQFTIIDPREMTFQETSQGDSGSDNGGDGLSTLLNNFSNIPDLVDSSLTDITNITKDFLKSGYSAKSGYTQTKGSITLYMPDSLEFSSSAAYNSFSLGALIDSVLGGIASKLNVSDKLKGALGNIGNIAKGEAGPTGQIVLDAAGFAINPQQQLIFQGIDFRSFAMAFVFTPKSSVESDTIKSIVQAFKSAAAPTLVENTAGFLYRPPSIFEITFYSEGKENTYLHKLGKSVLTDIQVNYAPNGWSAHRNGAPVQVTLGLQFQEVDLMHSAKIDEGY
jgi:hypothetical protein